MEYTENGAIWDIYDLQGKNNVWFIGGGLISEGLNNVWGYNNLLLSKMIPPTSGNQRSIKLVNRSKMGSFSAESNIPF